MEPARAVDCAPLGAVHPAAMITRGHFVLPATERRAAVMPAVAARVRPFDSRAKTVLATGSIAFSRRGTREDLLRWSRNAAFLAHR